MVWCHTVNASCSSCCLFHLHLFFPSSAFDVFSPVDSDLQRSVFYLCGRLEGAFPPGTVAAAWGKVLIYGQWGFAPSSIRCVWFFFFFFFKKSPILAGALQFKAPLQCCRIDSAPGSLWQCQGQGCVREPQGGESGWCSTGCVAAFPILTVIMQGSTAK